MFALHSPRAAFSTPLAECSPFRPYGQARRICCLLTASSCFGGLDSACVAIDRLGCEFDRSASLVFAAAGAAMVEDHLELDAIGANAEVCRAILTPVLLKRASDRELVLSAIVLAM